MCVLHAWLHELLVLTVFYPLLAADFTMVKFLAQQSEHYDNITAFCLLGMEIPIKCTKSLVDAIHPPSTVTNNKSVITIHY
jgi:hypothetical protein